MLIDLHCHTTRSSDSGLSPLDAIAKAKATGLDAICFTEHDYLWPYGEIRHFSQQHDFPVFNGVEVSTEIGHVLAFGLTEYSPALRSFSTLVKVAGRVGGCLILAHPYRRFFRFESPDALTEADVTAAMERRGLSDVHAIEAWNGATREIENLLAETVADRLLLPTTAGSDAHSVAGIGGWFSEFQGDISDEKGIVTALREHRVRGTYRPLPEEARPI